MKILFLLFFIVFDLLAVLPAEDESRIFISSKNLKLTDEHMLATNDWVQRHGSMIHFLSNRVRATIGSPTCLAIVRIGCIIGNAKIEHDIPLVFSSKSKLLKKTDRQVLTAQDLVALIKLDEDQELSGYDRVNQTFYKKYGFKPLERLNRADLKDHLKLCYQTDNLLPEERMKRRLAEIAAGKMHFFYHSEQALILEILKNENIVKEFACLFSVRVGEVKSFYLNVLGTFDSCCRCGDALHQFSGVLAREFNSQLKKQISTIISIPDEISWFVSYHGIHPYKEPEVTTPNPLRPSKAALEEPYTADPFDASKNFVPKIACTFN